MFKFCPECGVKLDKEFKFCPECGVNLSQMDELTESTKQENTSAGKSITVVICENCGEENSPENIVCAGCGVTLKDEKAAKGLKEYQAAAGHSDHKQKPKIPQKKIKNFSSQKQKNPGNTFKTLSKKNLYTIIAALFAVVILLLIFSGVFDAKKVSVTNPVQNQTLGSGVDLSNLQKINEMEARVKANPNDKELLLALAHLKNDSGLYEQAIVNYKQYLQMDPRNADARVDMGVCYYNLEDFKTAISEMETALKYKPDHQIAFLNLGIVNLAAGNLEKSKEWLKKAADQNPNNDIGKRAKELLESHTK